MIELTQALNDTGACVLLTLGACVVFALWMIATDKEQG